MRLAGGIPAAIKKYFNQYFCSPDGKNIDPLKRSVNKCDSAK